MAKIGIIGGSGVYKIEGIKNLKEIKVKTPFGAPSDVYRAGELSGVEVVFLPRHGSKHTISPSEINYRANVFGMKKLGVQRPLGMPLLGRAGPQPALQRRSFRLRQADRCGGLRHAAQRTRTAALLPSFYASKYWSWLRPFIRR